MLHLSTFLAAVKGLKPYSTAATLFVVKAWINVCVSLTELKIWFKAKTYSLSITFQKGNKQAMGMGRSSVGRASDLHATDAGSIPWCSKGFFFPRVHFQCRLSFGVPTSPCEITCIDICAHVKDPVVHVRVWWIMATQTYPAFTTATKIINLMIVVPQ